MLNGSNNTNYFIRNEGDAEGVGTISLSTTSTGTIKASSYIYIDYNVPLAHFGTLYAVGVTVTGDYASQISPCITSVSGRTHFTRRPTIHPCRPYKQHGGFSLYL